VFVEVSAVKEVSRDDVMGSPPSSSSQGGPDSVACVFSVGKSEPEGNML